MENIAIYISEPEFSEVSSALSKRLGIPVVEQKDSNGERLYLEYTKEGLLLMRGNLREKGDFSLMKNRLKPNNLNGEMLVKAAKIKGKSDLFLIDATAGMGEDSFLLAAAGFRVRLYERDGVIAELLRDALNRAKEDEELLPIVSRMELIEADSIEALGGMKDEVDVVLLDPMFPERKKKALVKKRFQLFHHLEKPCEDEEIMLNAAIHSHPKKIIIKRPVKGPYLADKKPDYSISGKAVRYDCFVFLDK